MDFSTSESTTRLLERARAFVHEHVIPSEPEVLEAGFLAAEPRLAQLRDQVKAAGMWGPQLPRELGGLGLTLVDHGLVSEVLGQSPLGHYVFGCQAPDAGNIEILHRYGTTDQKARFLEPLARGDVRSCFSMTEPDKAGSNPTQLACEARLDGDEYVINGRKWFTSSAEGASFAIVMAVTDPDGPPHRRASMILVPTDTPGFVRVRNVPLFGHAGSGYDSHAEIEYRDCRVPRANLLGPEHGGFAIAQERLGPGRIHHCMRWLGICERAFQMMCERAQTRMLAPGEPLGSKQIIQAWIAEARAKIEAARLLVLRTAWKIDRHGFYAAREDVSLIKFYTADVLAEVLERAIQSHGALGLTDDTILAFWYTRERGARIYDGPDEVHKVVVAKRILKRIGAATPKRAKSGPLPSAQQAAQASDEAAPVRAGEELDLEALGPYLRAQLELADDAEITVAQFPGGHSNLTYLVTAGDREFVLRRPPFGTEVKTAHDMEREYRVLSALAPRWSLAPRPLFLCADESLLGAKFYGMERRRGVILRRKPVPGLIPNAAAGAALSRAAIDTLASLHAIDYVAAGLGELGRPEGFVERQVNGWSRRYEDARTDEIPTMEALATWLSDHLPESGPPALIHNDFKFDNLVLDPEDLTRVTAILDWEMATVGDPLIDLGTALCYWVEAEDPEPMKLISFGPTALPGFYTRRQVAERYAEQTGRAIDGVLYYYIFGLFKTAVVTQQIYARFARGMTNDRRFAMMLEATKILAGQAERALTRGTL